MLKKFICGIIAATGIALSANAQEMPQLPMDTAVIYGTLPNGLTYYIRHNEYPKGQADFHIAQKVGSVLEQDNQRGLAHFLEHMCFNGTKNFPGNSLISYLESIGVKFGAQLNAYTGTDETVYMVTNVPTASTAVTDSVLLILHDWANELLLDPEEIDKERGVIHEEWRMSNVGQTRILQQLLPKIYPGSQYAERLPIGTMEVVDNFPHQALRDYYEAWYRPDLQGIVVSGDIDAKRTEEVIKQMFYDIEMPANAPVRVSYPVPDTQGTIYAIGSDKEQTNTVLYLMFKHEVTPRELRNTPFYLTYDYITDMISSMLNQRFADMMSNPATPFAVAQAQIGNYMLSNTEEMFAVLGAAKTGDIITTLQAIYREVLRASRGGFTQGEYDRARAEWLASLEKQYNNRESVENGTYTNQMIRHFIDGTPLMDIADLYPIMQQASQLIDINMINQTFAQMVTDDNRVVVCFLPDQAEIPTEQQLAEAMKSVDAEEIEVFADNVRTDPLIAQLPAPGTVTATEDLSEFEGTTAWTLSNGAKVYVKPTPFKSDEIVMQAAAPGGVQRRFGSAHPADVIALPLFAGNYGLGSYTNNDLQKYLAGKKASIQPDFGTYETQITGTATPKDLATLFELLHAYFTSVTYPGEEFEATQSLYSGLLQNQELNPQFIFQRDLTKTLYSSPYLQSLSADAVNQCSRLGIEELVKSQLTDASQWSFTFVGNFDPVQLKGLCEQYLANLPSTGQGPTRVNLVNPELEIASGNQTTAYTTPMETPQTWCAVVESATVPYNSVNAKLTMVASQILSARLLKTIREEMGAVYSIGAQGNIEPQVGRNAQFIIPFPMNPDQREAVLVAIKKEIDSMATEITAEELGKVKEYLIKSYQERAEQNPAWANYISQWYLTGQNNFSRAIAEVEAITPATVEGFVDEMNKQGNYRVVLLNPQN